MKAAARVVLLTDEAMDRHASPGHPERPDRRPAAVDGVREGAEAARARLEEPPVEPIDRHGLLRVHAPDYLALLDAADAGDGGWLDPDTYVVSGSVVAARLAAGATVAAARAVVGGDATIAFAAVRPPGHHASRVWGSGFCLLNSVALGVAALRDEGLARRVAILDWDVHHGNGTQAIFDGDADLCYASTHQWPWYPGTGGSGDLAAPPVHNWPLPAGSGDEAFVGAWRDHLLPAIAGFAPEAILVSAGYDAHRADPLAGLEVTEAGYREVARLVGAMAAASGLPGVALTLEGGYDLAALRASVAASVEGLLAGIGRGGDRAG